MLFVMLSEVNTRHPEHSRRTKYLTEILHFALLIQNDFLEFSIVMLSEDEVVAETSH